MRPRLDTPVLKRMIQVANTGSKSSAFLFANPEPSSGDIFQELQRSFPGHYQPLHIRPLQRGMRKIHAHLLPSYPATPVDFPSPATARPFERP